MSLDISVACDLLQITIGLCFFIRMYQRKQFNVSKIYSYTGSIVQPSVSTDVMMSLTIDYEAKKTRYAKLCSTRQ